MVSYYVIANTKEKNVKNVLFVLTSDILNLCVKGTGSNLQSSWDYVYLADHT